MNRLQHETSPYLLQHAHNPVDWYAWKSEAFEKAKQENKPILVSIGYSTCHWCHVMERESFENEQVAAFMNSHFINIKVDREERPDVDQIYMEACQVISGSGGWPLNCFLTPEGKPFYAGTYYPPNPAYNRPSWIQVLQRLSTAFQQQRKVVEEQADRLLEVIGQADTRLLGNKIEGLEEEQIFTPVALQTIFYSLKDRFDSEWGGFGVAPKFPGTMSLQYLLKYYFHYGEKAALEHVELSLDKMIMGGIYDQIGGGFARYSTDKEWLVPHFEKMLYDNALLVSLLAEAYKLTKKDLYKETIEETLDFIEREMTSGEGGFYSAQDADSEGVEGKYYVWKKEEVDSILGEDSELFCEFYDITENGNWEGNSIPWRKVDFEDFAKAKKIDVAKLKFSFEKNRQQLFSVRDKRIHPGLDDKILLSWNALQCSAYAKAYEALQEERYKEAAIRNMEFILKQFAQEEGKGFYHTYKNGQAQYDAFLEDYAFLIEALIDVYEISFDTNWILQAAKHTEFVLENFLDKDSKMFYFTSSNQKDLILRRKDIYDSATPSGNSTMVRNLQRLGVLLGKESYKRLAIEMLINVKDAIEKYPSSFGRWANALVYQIEGLHEIAVIGADAFEMGKKILYEYLSNKILMVSQLTNNDFPLLEGKKVQKDTLIYVCKDYACLHPVKTIEDFRQLIREK